MGKYSQRRCTEDWAACFGVHHDLCVYEQAGISNIGDSFRGSDFDDDDDVGDDDEDDERTDDDNESLFARAEAAESESKNKADLIRQLNDAPPPRGVGIDVVLNPGGWPVVTSLAEGGPAHKSGITCLARRVS